VYLENLGTREFIEGSSKIPNKLLSHRGLVRPGKTGGTNRNMLDTLGVLGGLIGVPYTSYRGLAYPLNRKLFNVGVYFTIAWPVMRLRRAVSGPSSLACVKGARRKARKSDRL